MPKLSHPIVLILLGLIVFGAGIGLRDPWPADEPRFALVAREMVETGQWLFPRRAGFLYADKPPLFFWTTASFYWLTGSIKLAFRLPAVIASLITLLLVYDLSRRLFGSRGSSFLSALSLLVTLQFTIQARSGQIDGFLIFWTTLGLYGLARHLLTGPAPGWWLVAFASMGFGVITKGVGFLPLLMLIPWAIARSRGAKLPQVRIGWKLWLGGALMLLLAIATWLVPMLLAVEASGDPGLEAYRDNILLKQTGERYARAWHHYKWPGYFLVEVIPWAWLPFSLMLPWAIPAWWRRIRRGDGRILTLIGWVLLVVLFFSISAGKRGLYILPALPALAIAMTPLLRPIFVRPRFIALTRWTCLALAIALIVASIGLVVKPSMASQALERVNLRVLALLIFLPGAFALLLGTRPGSWRPEHLGMALIGVWIVLGFGIEPLIDGDRSARRMMQNVNASLAPGDELGIVSWREQFALHADRPVQTFGYARSDLIVETKEAIQWMLASTQSRRLLVPEDSVAECFDETRAVKLERQSRRVWYLAGTDALKGCR